MTLRSGDAVHARRTHPSRFAGRSGLVVLATADVIFVRFGPSRAHRFEPADLVPVMSAIPSAAGRGVPR